DQLVPLNRKYPIAEVVSACQEYAAATRRRITFEYVMIDGVTDTRRQSQALVDVAGDLLCHVNLIPLNPVPETGLHRSPQERIAAFARHLRKAGIPTTIRKERGTDIQAACGQLRRSAGR